ncbi:MAG TPA: HEAT repeat domain-containing protein [Longimicrobiales bacterium]|nr:HEAT repeat domain-containing protein [Longimicrobiales bacterium]
MTPFAGTGLSLLLDAALKGTIVLLAASALVLVMRRGSAASRHLIWQLALIAVLALPVIKLVSPFRLPVLPTFRSPIATPVARPQPLDNTVAAPRPTNEGNATSPAISTSSTSGAPATAATSLAPADNQASTAARPVLVRVLFWTALIWMGIAAVLLLRLAIGFVLVRWFALRAYPLYENGWHELNGDLAHLVGLKQPVQLLGSPHIATPMTWGVARPVVMLPSAAEDWSDERRRVVLLHELAHIRRKDSLTHMFAQLACALYWFHPLVWKAAARMRAEAERACDDLVLRAGTRASVYADHLLELIRTIGGMRTPAVALPMAQRSTFEGRLLAILEPHLDRSAPRPLAVGGMIVILALIVLPLAGLTSGSELNALPTVINEIDKKDAVADDANVEKPTGKVSGHALDQGKESEASENVMANVAGFAVGNAQVKSGQASAAAMQASAAAMQSLIGALGDKDAEVRLSAAQSLGGLEDERAIIALSNALRNDSDARVRKMAAWALGNIEDARALPALTHALKNDRDIEVRRTAVWALGQIEDRAAVPALAEAMRDNDAEVRSMAVWALGQIEDAAAVPALTQALRSEDVGMRRRAAWALGQIEDASAVPALANALRDGDVEVRTTAVWALGQIEAESAVEPLSGLTNDANAEVRKQAAWALGQIEAASAVPALSRLVREDRDVSVRSTAVWALGQIESASAVPALNAALKDANADVRKQAAWALGQIESRPAPQALLDALKDSDARVRSTAAWALAQIEDPGSAAALRAAMRDENPDVRRAVLRALTQIGDEAGFEALAEMLKDPDPEVRKAAAAAMGGRRGVYVDPRPQPRPQPRPDPRPNPIN